MIVSKEIFEKATKTRASALEFAAENGLTLSGDSASEIKQSLIDQLEVDEVVSFVDSKLNESDVVQTTTIVEVVNKPTVHSISNHVGDIIFKTYKEELTVIINGVTYTEKANDGLVFVSTGKAFGAYPSIDYVE